MVSDMRMRRLAPFSRKIATLTAYAWMALCSAIHVPSALAHDDADQIRALIGTTWDKPGSKVAIDPVVISGHHAIASWTQGPHGGRALLRRDDKGWSVVLCSGDPLKEARWLAEAGVPPSDASRLATDLAAAEARVPPERRTKFSLFEGVVQGDGTEHAPHHQTHP